jgi:hypothetical protein
MNQACAGVDMLPPCELRSVRWVVERSVRLLLWRRRAPSKGQRSPAVAIEAGDDPQGCASSLADLGRIGNDGDDGHAGFTARAGHDVQLVDLARGLVQDAGPTPRSLRAKSGFSRPLSRNWATTRRRQIFMTEEDAKDLGNCPDEPWGGPLHRLAVGQGEIQVLAEALAYKEGPLLRTGGA